MGPTGDDVGAGPRGRFSALTGGLAPTRCVGPIRRARPARSAAAFRFCSTIMLSMNGPSVLVLPACVCVSENAWLGSASAAKSLTLDGSPSKS